ncbi:MAG: proline dehydrogenase family protein [Flavobacteriales bacterium]|nr:proline dehydrogenase family protein [Flavobacteriales bacterium]
MVSFDNTEVAFASKNDAALTRAWLLFKLISKPWMVVVGKVMVKIALTLRIPIGWALRNNVFEHFCGGETISECAETTKVLDNHHIGTILDFSVEGKESEKEFERSKKETLETLRVAHSNDNIPFCVFKVTGLARFALLEKVNANAPLTDAEISEYQRVKSRVNEICQMAYETGTPLFIDAEESWIQDAIDAMVTEMMEMYNTERPLIYNTLQMYRHDRLAFLEKAFQEASQKGYHLAVKLVRGAYMEKERDRAREKGYPSPIQPDKASTDQDYDLAQKFCIEHLDRMAVCSGTHNEVSSHYLTELMAQYGIAPSDKRVYFAQLFGMSDHISFNLANAGYNVAKYVPYGPIRDVIPYLIRRAEENTSVKGQTGRELGLILKERKRRKSKA